jgi:hypothetical protein
MISSRISTKADDSSAKNQCLTKHREIHLPTRRYGPVEEISKMPFAACRASSVVFRAIATDSLAAASQLLADVQRFGLQMVEFRMMVDGEGGAAIDFGIEARPDRDPAVLCSRFARHPALRSVEVVGRSPVKTEGTAP